MKTKVLYFLFFFLLCPLSLMFTSCGSDDENDKIEDPSEENHWGLSDAEWQNWLQQEADLADSMNIVHVIKQLCNVEEDVLGNMKYTPKLGEVLNLATPNVYSVADSTAENAEQRFWNLLPPDLEDSLKTYNQGQLSYTTKYGTISYERGDGLNCFGAINIEIPELSEMKRLEIIPTNLWPSNDSSSPFSAGSVWRNKHNGYRFICVRPKCWGSKGILVTYDGGWSGLDFWHGEDGVLKDCHTSWIYDNLASTDAAKALDEFVRTSSKAQSAFNAMGYGQYCKPNKGDERYYATERSGKKFHWGPSDYHYNLKVYKVWIGANKYETEEWKTCDSKTMDMRNRKNYLMYSQEFDYMDTNTRDSNWERISK